MSTVIDGSASVTINSGAVLGITSGTAVASTSGTSIDFTGIPSWVKRITVMLSGVSTNGTSPIQLQIGSGSISTTGYLTNATGITDATVISTLSNTAGVTVRNGITAGLAFSGIYTFALITSNTWIVNGICSDDTATRTGISAGSKTLSGTLDRIRITTVNGTDTFDAGSINILYE